MNRAVPFLLILLVAAPAFPVVEAQAPVDPRDIYGMKVTLDRSFNTVQYLQKSNFTVTIEDISRDDGQSAPAIGRLVHTILVENTVIEGLPSGWAASTDDTAFTTTPGDIVRTTLRVTAGAAIQQPYVRVNMTLAFIAGDTVIRDTVTVAVQVAPYYIALVLVKEVPPPQKQQKIVAIPVQITNLGLYPDKFLLNASAREGWKVSIPPEITLNALETRTVYMNVQTPKRGIYEFGELSIVEVSVKSANDPFVAYTRSTVVKVQGFYFSSYWQPLTIFTFLAVGLLVARSAERSGLRNGEDGKPRPFELTPRQRVLLGELKKRDPEAYKARMAQLAAIHRTRRETYRRIHKTRIQDEKRLMKAEHREAKEELALRKEAASEQKEAEKAKRARVREIEKERAKRLAAILEIRRKQDKIDGKERKKREKVLGKERKKTEKALAKQMKADAKAAKKAARKAKPGMMSRMKRNKKGDAESGGADPGDEPRNE